MDAEGEESTETPTRASRSPITPGSEDRQSDFMPIMPDSLYLSTVEEELKEEPEVGLGVRLGSGSGVGPGLIPVADADDDVVTFWPGRPRWILPSSG